MSWWNRSAISPSWRSQCPCGHGFGTRTCVHTGLVALHLNLAGINLPRRSIHACNAHTTSSCQHALRLHTAPQHRHIEYTCTRPLSTFLFDVYIDDLLEELHTRPAQHCIEMEGKNDTCRAELTYADDLNAMSLSPHGLEGHIDVVDSWLHRWRLSPNVTKSKTMTFNPAPGHPESVFTVRGVQLQAVQTFKYLGVYFHQDCTWTEHVQYVRGRMNKALGMWRPVLQCHYLPASIRIGLAYTFVYTHALYGAEAWAAPRNELDKMDAGSFQVVYPLGLWSRFSGAVNCKVLLGHG